ncbi:hypothetical protein BCAR13_860073 [Paraburkholderia caribensis]|nr:hypothetical protein BCAR13_860073 [Paraburkholderia caribensis]
MCGAAPEAIAAPGRGALVGHKETVDGAMWIVDNEPSVQCSPIQPPMIEYSNKGDQ